MRLYIFSYHIVLFCGVSNEAARFTAVLRH